MEFVKQTLEKDRNISQLCRKYGISRKTGYKWLRRYQAAGVAGLRDRSRRPQRSPNRTPAAVEQQVLKVRDAHPAWGGRKIRRRLEMLGADPIPSPSTITEILRRHGRIDPAESDKHRAWQRFEAEHPNQMWQMDFKGHFAMANGERCHPLTLLDDHSRFCLGLQACANERRVTVQHQLTNIFHTYGMPEALLMDNGPPWGTEPRRRLTHLGVWLVRLGIRMIHTRAYHPQTIGKEERFHRTLKREVLREHTIHNLAHAQHCFDPWRQVYNHERPHEALALHVPASRYQPSPRPFPETLPPVAYDASAVLRKVDKLGKIYYKNKRYRVGRALQGYRVALQPTDVDGQLAVYFCDHQVAIINLRYDTEKV
jgi:transposase InsO family protein